MKKYVIFCEDTHSPCPAHVGRIEKFDDTSEIKDFLYSFYRYYERFSLEEIESEELAIKEEIDSFVQQIAGKEISEDISSSAPVLGDRPNILYLGPLNDLATSDNLLACQLRATFREIYIDASASDIEPIENDKLNEFYEYVESYESDEAS